MKGWHIGNDMKAKSHAVQATALGCVLDLVVHGDTWLEPGSLVIADQVRNAVVVRTLRRCSELMPLSVELRLGTPW